MSWASILNEGKICEESPDSLIFLLQDVWRGSSPTKWFVQEYDPHRDHHRHEYDDFHGLKLN